MIPWEKEIYLALLEQYIEEENLKRHNNRMAFSSKIFMAPKIGKGNISSPLSSGASKITKATPKLRVNRINFGNRRVASSPALESQSSIENTLSETNRILVEIQKAT